MKQGRQELKRMVLAAALCIGAVGAARATVVTQFDASYVANGQWYSAAVSGATASVGAAPAGGPLPTGAAKLTTDGTTSSKIEVSVADAYGQAAPMLRGLNLHYSYYKDVSAGNAETAPSIKLTFLNSAYNSVPGNDGFVTLIYEPYWNQPSGPGSSVPPPLSSWTGVDIDFTHGLFWTTAGFGQANGAGGPPLNTLSDWLSLFNSTSGNAFSAADMVQLTLGIGSNTPNQIGYFDDVRISNANTGYSANYDFEPAGRVPEPGTLALVGLALIGLAWTRKKTRD